MILYTPMQLELVFDGLDNQQYPAYRLEYWDGVPVLSERLNDGRRRLIRVLSTNPFHYLDRRFWPGSLRE